MPSTLIRIAVVGAAVLAGIASPALAQTHMRHRAYHAAQYGYGDPNLESSYVAAHPGAPTSVNNQPGACFTDEGYGRFASCDGGGGN
jgi:hypothetical protein